MNDARDRLAALPDAWTPLFYSAAMTVLPERHPLLFAVLPRARYVSARRCSAFRESLTSDL